MQNYSFAEYGKPEHADLRALILATSREGKTFHETLQEGLRGHAREQLNLWEQDLITYLEALEERDAWKERFEHLRDALSRMIDLHRHCGTRPREAASTASNPAPKS